MEISVNGEKKNFSAPLTVAELLHHLGIKAQSVVVERNLNIVARALMETETIREGDAVEIIRLVGGG